MLYVVLALVIAAAALLVASLLTTITVYAWVSVGISVLAALLLVTDALLRRHRRRKLMRAAQVSDEHDETEEAADSGGGREADETTVIPAVTSAPRERKHTKDAEPVTEQFAAVPAREAGEKSLDPDIEPEEEDTDIADSLAVGESTEHVTVIDERPRYHLPSCRWVGSREVFTLPVNEVRDLGFTPCGLCAPDRHIAAKAKQAATSRSSGR
jgi:hypothetical protein